MIMFQEVKDVDAITEEEGEFLYGLVKTIKPAVCAETGTHKGYSALYIAWALFDNKTGHLWTTDIKDMGAEENFKRFKFEKNVTFKNIKGIDLNLENIDFLFIDGFHEKEIVIEEMKHFLPRLSEGAIVIFHDCAGDNDMVGVNAAIDELKLKTVIIPTENVMRIYSHQRSFN